MEHACWQDCWLPPGLEEVQNLIVTVGLCSRRIRTQNNQASAHADVRTSDVEPSSSSSANPCTKCSAHMLTVEVSAAAPDGEVHKVGEKTSSLPTMRTCLIRVH